MDKSREGNISMLWNAREASLKDDKTKKGMALSKVW